MAEVLSRRCVIMRLADFSYDKYQKALRQSAGAVVIILPKNMSAMPQDIVQQFMELEPEMLATETIVPVYFAEEDNELLSIYTQTLTSSSSQGSLSAAEVLLHTATANGFQMVTSGAQSKAISDWAITSLEVRHTETGRDRKACSDVCKPWLSYGADSNGSGVSMLLELARLFSKLYTYKRTHAAYNLLFFVSGGGKFNYQGTKRWLEDNLDHTDSSLLQDNVAFVLCLDTLGNGDSLYLHVSKPPKEGTPQYSLLKELETVVASQHPEVKFSMVHKKINLAEDMLAWEHERFGIRRLPAFTLSHLPSHRSAQRSSIMDVRSVSPSSRHGSFRSQTLVPFFLSFPSSLCPSLHVDVFVSFLHSILPYYPCFVPIPPFNSSFLSFLFHSCLLAFQPFLPCPVLVPFSVFFCPLFTLLKNISAFSRDPEFVFYDQLKQTMNAYRVKPAIFDLLLAFCIAAYLGMMYLAIQNFGLLYSVVRRITLPKAKVH
uniref:BOS complex subunit NCLN n=1 Tax=Fundulus heteroclitus TaxID=8078 RepID=A0A3Q2QAW6_FUNHE